MSKRDATRGPVPGESGDEKGRQAAGTGGEHWPAGIGRTPESEPHGIMAGHNPGIFSSESLQKCIEKTSCSNHGGGFDDEPFDRYVTKYAMAINSRKQVRKATKPPGSAT